MTQQLGEAHKRFVHMLVAIPAQSRCLEVHSLRSNRPYKKHEAGNHQGHVQKPGIDPGDPRPAHLVDGTMERRQTPRCGSRY